MKPSQKIRKNNFLKLISIVGITRSKEQRGGIELEDHIEFHGFITVHKLLYRPKRLTSNPVAKSVGMGKFRPPVFWKPLDQF